jgi:3-oxoacyl-[acyl-carrier protein] reductase
MTNLRNRVALVTGSARGIGKTIAERLGALGASVVINYSASERQAQETVCTIERLGGTAIDKPTSQRWPTSPGFLRRPSSDMAA